MLISTAHQEVHSVGLCCVIRPERGTGSLMDRPPEQKWNSRVGRELRDLVN